MLNFPKPIVQENVDELIRSREIKPCPICGSAPKIVKFEVYEEEYEDHASRGRSVVFCNKCCGNFTLESKINVPDSDEIKWYTVEKNPNVIHAVNSAITLWNYGVGKYSYKNNSQLSFAQYADLIKFFIKEIYLAKNDISNKTDSPEFQYMIAQLQVKLGNLCLAHNAVSQLLEYSYLQTKLVSRLKQGLESLAKDQAIPENIRSSIIPLLELNEDIVSVEA